VSNDGTRKGARDPQQAPWPCHPGIDGGTPLEAAVGAGLLLPGVPLLGGSPARAQFKADPFTLGVASGRTWA
jgi:hypothetical protein